MGQCDILNKLILYGNTLAHNVNFFQATNTFHLLCPSIPKSSLHSFVMN